jgi:plasmid maintenance system antidote protein VapI
LRLARFFGTDAQSWMNLQTHYDLAVTEEAISGRLDREVIDTCEGYALLSAL